MHKKALRECKGDVMQASEWVFEERNAQKVTMADYNAAMEMEAVSTSMSASTSSLDAPNPKRAKTGEHGGDEGHVVCGKTMAMRNYLAQQLTAVNTSISDADTQSKRCDCPLGMEKQV